MRRWLAGLGLLLFGLVGGLAIVEVVPRLFAPLMPKEFRGLERVYAGRAKWQEMMVPDTFLGYRPRPQLHLMFPSEGRKIPVQTTSYGLGDIGFRDIGMRPPFDAIALGDSFTFCDDVPAESCWVRKVAELTGLSVGTLGVSGYSTLAEARILKRYGRQLQPRLVLQTVFPNDFNDNVEFDRWTRSGTDDFWTWRAGREGRGPLGRWLAQHSLAYRLAESQLRAFWQKTYHYKHDDLDLIFRVDRWWLGSSDTERIQDRERGWQLMQTALLDMRATIADVRGELVVVLIPTKEEVYWEIVRQHLSDKQNAAADRPLQVVREFCETQRIAYCDLTPALQAEARRGRQLYLRVSGHWTDEGNAVAGRAIARCLGERGLLNAPGAADGATTAAMAR